MPQSDSNAKKAVVIVIVFLLSAFLLYAVVCAGLTFIPLLKMKEVNKTACGESRGEDGQVIVLENDVNLYYFPVEHDYRQKYVIICPGGGYLDCSTTTEGFPAAAEFNRMGYTAFVLEYRTGRENTEFQGPIKDLANAIYYIDEHAEELGVLEEHYALCGFSAGGNLIGLFGTEKYGYGNFIGIEKPMALIMAYPWSNPDTVWNGNLVDTIYYDRIARLGADAFLGKGEDLDQMRVPLWVTEDFPRTFIMHGDKDGVVPSETSDLLAAKLEENGVEYVYKKYENVMHACGIGLGTNAEGWLEEAVAFWDEKWYEEDFVPLSITCDELTERAGGFINGVCHPVGKMEQLADLGAEWVRIDIGVAPLDSEGNVTPYYSYFTEEIRYCASQGLKVFAVTPYPNAYLGVGIDPRTEEGKIKVMESLRFLMDDLGEYVSAFQITNEMCEPQFRAPLTMEEAAEFVGIQLKAAYRYRGDILVGYNYSATDFAAYAQYMKPYNQYADYVGIDLYLGCFEAITQNFGLATANAWLWYMRETTGRPLIFTEFGYIGEGERKSEAEKLEILRLYGAVGDTFREAEAYAREHVVEFMNDEDFPVSLRERVYVICSTEQEMANALFGAPGVTIDLSGHLYMELGEGIELLGYPHNPEGQAAYFTAFYEEVIEPCEYLCGAIVYCFSDSERCYVCGQEHCPIETCWGLLYGNGEKKPSFYAVKEAMKRCKDKKVVAE